MYNAHTSGDFEDPKVSRWEKAQIRCDTHCQEEKDLPCTSEPGFWIGTQTIRGKNTRMEESWTIQTDLQLYRFGGRLRWFRDVLPIDSIG
jgi:hypothetical protein